MPNRPPKAKPKRNKNINKKPFRYSQYSKDDIIYSRHWKNLRQSYLARYPICQRCIYFNKVTDLSTKKLSVHHIKMRNVYKDLALCESNLLSLCKMCHNYYSMLEANERYKESIDQGTKVKEFFNKQESGK